MKITPLDRVAIDQWIDIHYGEHISFLEHRQSLEDLVELILEKHSGNKTLDEALNEGDGTYRP